jgi:hypothetical protein
VPVVEPGNDGQGLPGCRASMGHPVTSASLARVAEIPFTRFSDRGSPVSGSHPASWKKSPAGVWRVVEAV